MPDAQIPATRTRNRRIPAGPIVLLFLLAGFIAPTPIATSAYAGSSPPQTAAVTSTASPIRVIEEDASGVTIEVISPSPLLERRGRYLHVAIPEWGSLREEGKPALPVLFQRIALPPGADPTLVILEDSPEMLASARVEPFPTLRVPGGRNGSAGAAPVRLQLEDRAVYEGAGDYPDTPLALGETGLLRGVPFVDLVIRPVAYTPGAPGEEGLSFRRRMKARIDFGAARVPEPSRRAGPAVPGSPEEEARRSRGGLALSFVNAGQASRIERLSASEAAAGRMMEPPTRRPPVDHAPTPAGATPVLEPAAGYDSTVTAGVSSIRGTEAASAVAAASLRYKLTVNKDGIYRLTHAWVQANAPDLLTHAPSTFRIMDLGVEIPIRVVDQDGDGTFEGNGAAADDYIEFVGQKLAWDILDPDDWQGGDWTDNNVYWLDAATAPGLRATSRTGGPVSGYPVAPDFPETWHHEVDDLFVQGIAVDTGDHWQQKPGVVAFNNTPASVVFNVSLPDISTTTTQASIKVKLLGDSFATYHRSDILVNGVVVDGCGDGAAGCGNQGGGCEDWDGLRTFVHGQDNGPVDFCQSTLTPTTAVTVRLPLGRVVNGNPVTSDTAYMDWIEIGYGRQFKVAGDTLTFNYANASTRFQVTGLSTNQASVYEITKTLSGGQLYDPVRITGATISGTGPFTLTFEVPFDAAMPATRKYLVATNTASATTGDLEPAAVALYTPSDILAPPQGADWMLITDSDLLDTSPASPTQQLIAYRQNTQGKRVRTVLVEQIYDEFSYGIFDPQAIRDFLTYAYANWPAGPGGERLSQVVFLGDAAFDTKNNYGVPQKRVWVPTYMRTIVSTNSIVGYYSDDVYFARVDGPDEMPDIDIGRLPAHTMSEANDTFAKMLAYEQQAKGQAWQQNVVLTAENTTFDFKNIQEAVKTTWLDGTPNTVNRIYQIDLEPMFPGNPVGLAAEVRDRIQRNINGQIDPARDIGPGAAVFAFLGHGSWQNWGLNATIIQTKSSGTDDITPLTNVDRMPLLFVANCLSGGFHVTSSATSATDLTYALGEDFVTTAGKGAIATLAPAHLTYIHTLDLEHNAVFGSMYGATKERNLGQVALALREAFAAIGATVEMRSYSLEGDPATTLVMPAPAPPTGTAITVIGNRQLTLGWTPSPEAATYNVYRSLTPDTGYALVGSGVTGNGFTDTGLQNCKDYYYQVASVDGSGFEGRRSNFNVDCPGAGDCLSAAPLNPLPPSAPAGVTAVDAESGGRVDVSWLPNPAGDDVTEYIVRWSTLPGDPFPPNELRLLGTAASLTGLTNGVPVYVKVSATNCSQGEGPASIEVAATPNLVLGIRPPRWVSDLMVTREPDPGDGMDDVRLTWSPPTLDIYGKPTTIAETRIYHATAGPQFPLDAPHLLVTLPGAPSTWVHENAFADPSNHHYLVVAIDTNGFASGGGHELPKGIDDLSVVLSGPAQLTLSWSPITTDLNGLYDPASQYLVYGSSSLFSRAQTFGMTPVATVPSTSLPLALPSGTVFFYSVIAVDARGNQSPY